MESRNDYGYPMLAVLDDPVKTIIGFNVQRPGVLSLVQQMTQAQPASSAFLQAQQYAAQVRSRLATMCACANCKHIRELERVKTLTQNWNN